MRLLGRFRAACQAGEGNSAADSTPTPTSAATPTSVAAAVTSTAATMGGDDEKPVEFTAASWPSQDRCDETLD